MKRRLSTQKTTRPKRRKTAMPSNVRQELRRTYDVADYKVTDTFANATGITGSGAIVDVMANLVPGTAGLNNFVGNKVNAAGWTFKYTWTVGDATNICRTILFQWLDSSIPVVTTVLQAANALSTPNFVNRENVNILKDNIHTMAITATGGTNIVNGTIYVKGSRMLPSQYNAAAGHFNKGALYALVISDSTVLPNPQFVYYSRITYLDQ